MQGRAIVHADEVQPLLVFNSADKKSNLTPARLTGRTNSGSIDSRFPGL
jgi:hypothetical protein